MADLLSFLVCDLEFEAHFFELCPESVILVLQEQDEPDQLFEGHFLELGDIVAWRWRDFALGLFNHLASLVDVERGFCLLESAAKYRCAACFLPRLGKTGIRHVEQVVSLVGLFLAELLVRLDFHVFACAADGSVVRDVVGSHLGLIALSAYHCNLIRSRQTITVFEVEI